MRTRDTEKEDLVRQKAIELIVNEGFDGFSMQKLAKAAQISPATLYIYYKDRDDLLVKLCLSVVDDMLAISLKDFHPELPFAEGMALQWRNRLEFFMKYPLETEFLEQARYSPLYAKVQVGIASKFGSVLGPFVHRAIENGELQRLSFEVYWSVAFAPLYQLMKFHNQGLGPSGVKFQLTEPVMKQALGLVLKALKP
ncbi:TetR/AcrR family transcriptional regulator [Paraflavitalea sp. CAU 1676]|uniref:TetR/AcrR family transcriptional regulator n=1 Tax=Paraflavitalea sp. CAU 1676 TaxID=3032598 RepID=UPI0023DAABBD|nr:TetR/AcrR family transcriptional regulator [Paraflavitalea sp. CAU 1676]MDF2190097.1 TetR/AcrR family transcriptional regulator [Paraflavitalea sp. CAU 1676]